MINGKSVITAEIQTPPGKAVLSAWAVVYKPSYQPPPAGEGLVQETLPMVMLQDTDNDGVYTGSYEGFDEVGAYRLAVQAVDGEGLYARPRAVATLVGAC